MRNLVDSRDLCNVKRHQLATAMIQEHNNNNNVLLYLFFVLFLLMQDVMIITMLYLKEVNSSSRSIYMQTMLN